MVVQDSCIRYLAHNAVHQSAGERQDVGHGGQSAARRQDTEPEVRILSSNHRDTNYVRWVKKKVIWNEILLFCLNILWEFWVFLLFDVPFIFRLRNLQLGLDQQRALLEQICTKLRVDGAKDNTSIGQTMDSMSYYDNVTMYSALDTPIEKTDRRPSLIPWELLPSLRHLLHMGVRSRALFKQTRQKPWKCLWS